MTTIGWLPAPADELFGPDATAEESYDVLTVDVPPASWITSLRVARDDLSCTYFDWLSAVDEPGTGFRIAAHLVALTPVRRLLVRTTVPHASPTLPSAVDLYAGAAWHERETHEMFGVRFDGHPGLDHLLLPENFEGHPLRKDFVLAARVAKAWPGAKEPGESEHGGPKRRQMLPPGVPDPNEWGPLKGQLPPAPSRPTRATGERPPRRTRTTDEGSASQPPAPGAGTGAAGTGAGRETEAASSPAPPQAPAGPRRARTATGGSASQRATTPENAPDTPAAAPQTPAGPRRARTASEGSASQRTQPPTPDRPATAPRSADAPWHHARPAFADRDEEPKRPAPGEPEPVEEPQAGPAQEPESPQEPEAAQEPEPEPEPGPAPDQASDSEQPQPDSPSTEPPTPETPPGGSR
ncbi:NADH-quinone oxidoreductase subunit C [Streptomyces antibioticus]|uniref:NADH-quinone oxidoreductase subunit C n=1 Tax=Streptomyces antibioticus TaxID=1890 RepID=UPI0022527C5F|nr:NADH-quinone oxidoreductase subunit C [Streptomyces antibioticus]MCX4737374.1 NADH-quinone oxidoreductase subunit C [Streptomyces antibioticus]